MTVSGRWHFPLLPTLICFACILHVSVALSVSSGEEEIPSRDSTYAKERGDQEDEDDDDDDDDMDSFFAADLLLLLLVLRRPLRALSLSFLRSLFVVVRVRTPKFVASPSERDLGPAAAPRRMPENPDIPDTLVLPEASQRAGGRARSEGLYRRRPPTSNFVMSARLTAIHFPPLCFGGREGEG